MLKSILEKDPLKRATLDQILESDWITKQKVDRKVVTNPVRDLSNLSNIFTTTSSSYF